MKQPIVPAITRYLALFLFVAALSACRVEGPQGPPGQDGRDGQDGNANIISINYEAIESDWYDVGTPGEDDYFLALDFEVPEIDQAIVDNGLVLVYYRETGNSNWFALPYTAISHNPEYIEKMDVIYDLEFVGIQSKASDRSATPYAGIFRVIVADAVPVGKREIDYTNYTEVAEFLGITEGIQQYR